MPVYAECGGFMYLMEKLIDFEGGVFPMLGVVPGEARMNRKLQTVGYVQAEMARDTVLGAKGTILRGHEFHFSSERASEAAAYPRAFTLRRMRQPERPYPAGYARDNVLGSYLHLHFAGCPDAAAAFVAACRAFAGKGA